MKLSKFLMITISVTILALVYVHQQTEIFRLAYICQKRSAIFQEVLDKNTFLRYNIKRNTSLVRIDDKVGEYAKFEMPDTYRLVRLQGPAGTFTAARQQNLFSRLFGIKRQAEAKTLSPAALSSSVNPARR